MIHQTFYAIIVAGGAGKRMNSSLPKQFLNIAGKPILMHTIEKFYHCEYKPKIIIVLSENDLSTWTQKVKELNFDIPHEVVVGGKERFFSVKNGLDAIIEKDAVIAIHDAVRPLVSPQTINNSYKSAMINGNAVTAVPSRDSIRIVENEKNIAIPRTQVYLVQTPQTFSSQQLIVAYEQQFSNDFTDDASVVEKAGFRIFIEDGDHTNIKITYEEDLILAEALLKSSFK